MARPDVRRSELQVLRWLLRSIPSPGFSGHAACGQRAHQLVASWLTATPGVGPQGPVATAYVLQLKDPEDFTSRYRITVTEASTIDVGTRPAASILPPITHWLAAAVGSMLR